MPALRKLLRTPAPHLVVVLAVLTMLAVDCRRPAGSQATAMIYARVIDAYQGLARPLLRGRVECRFVPSCSEYSRQAVRRHGVVRGLELTARRLARCQESVPRGTLDEVP